MTKIIGYHYLTTLLFFVIIVNANAQRKPFQYDNTYTYDTAISMPWYSNYSNIYRIPTDSIEDIVYNGRRVNNDAPWIQQPTFRIPYNEVDSFFNTDKVATGYYLIARTIQGSVYFSIRRKAAIIANIIMLRDVAVLEVQHINNTFNEKAIVMLGNNLLHYDAKMKGYVLNLKKRQKLRVKYGNDLLLFSCSKKRNKKITENDYYDSYNYYTQQVAYKGYFVTNQPVYKPGDTVKYKAYLLNDKDNTPIEEPMQVKLRNSYPEVYLGTITPQAPGVYFSEFSLGDSIKPDRIYEIALTGAASGAEYTQQFKVEDYLLDETYLRVTGENIPYYQPGDSVHLYAYGYNSNGLPVLDGMLSIRVVNNGYEMKKSVRQVFIPDTIYNATVPVNPEGDTYLGFSTQDFPDVRNLNLQCYISLTNSNFERKDTTFSLLYNADGAYVKASEHGDTLRAELIKNKRTITGKGYYYDSKGEKVVIHYPFEKILNEYDKSFTFYQTNDANGIINANTYSLHNDSLDVVGDYQKDTAYFTISNPKKILFRYALYRANKYISDGICERDTILKIKNKAGATYTIIMDYTWAGERRSKTTAAYRILGKMIIDIKKKDIVYPGQTDTININLSDINGKGINNTNVTVLAFNSRFKEDYTPQLAAAGIIKPGLGEMKFNKIITVDNYSQDYTMPITRKWLKLLSDDTTFFYRNIYFNPAHIATYAFKLTDTNQSQLAIYIREGNAYTAPEVIYDADIPLYVKLASVSTNPDALFIKEGIHYIKFRTYNKLYTINPLTIKKGYKTNLFINEPELDSTNTRIIQPFVNYNKMNDSLDYWERDAIAKRMIFYRNEQSQHYSFMQGYNQFVSRNAQNIVSYHADTRYGNENTYYQNYDEPRGYSQRQILSFAPLDVNDSVSFFQAYNMKMRFLPELHFIYSLRPGMIRMERMSAYQLFNKKFNYISTVPSPNTICITAPNIDTLDVIPTPPPSPESITKWYRFEDHLWNIDDTVTAKLLVNVTNMKLLAIRSVEKNNAPYIFNISGQNYINQRLPQGLYNVFFLLNDTSYYEIRNIFLRSKGTTVYIMPNDSFRYNQDAPPDWLKPYAYIEYNEGHIELTSQKIDSDTGMISVSIVNELGRSLPDVTYEITHVDKEDTIKNTTNNDGMFSAHLLKSMQYNMLIKKAGYKELLIKDITVDSNHIFMKIFLEVSDNPLRQLQTVTYYDNGSYYEGDTIAVYGERIEPKKMAMTGSVSVVRSEYIEEEVAHPAPPSSTNVYMRGSASLSADEKSLDAVVITRTSDDQPYRQTKDRSSNFLNTDKAKQFIATFLNDMQQASGIRKDFRDWAIWQPNLWTDKYGNTHFSVKYPDNSNSWKTYVLAMNPKGFAGTAFRITKAFKPLSAELSMPRFLRYGDSVEIIGKLMNYSGQAITLNTTFTYDSLKNQSQNITLQNGKTEMFAIAAPTQNTTDTAQLTASYILTTENSYSDGEEKSIPVLPVGAIENKGIFVTMMRDTAFSSQPTGENYFTGKTRITIDGSLIDVMLNEVENLKEYPYGCTEQLTTKLLAIYYEESIKKLLGNDTFNNTKTKKQIVDKLVQAQANNGSFGWFAGNATDYRITNYVTSTLGKVNNNGWLSYIIDRSLSFLNSNLDNMRYDDLVASLATLSDAGYATNYKTYLQELDTMKNSVYNAFILTKIRKQQKLPYRHQLDSLIKLSHQTVNGIYWGERSYDWYRNDLATTLIAYQLLQNDSIYTDKKDDVLKYLLFKRNKGYYSNTAESGLVLTTLLPEILKNNESYKHSKRNTSVYISGSITDTVSTYPKIINLVNKKPEFHFIKEGISPTYVSIVYQYFNTRPQIQENDFKVKTYFISSNDTLAELKQGEKVTMRVAIECLKDAEYVMIEAPIPAGCIQVNKSNNNRYNNENYRENYKDRTVLFISNLPKGNYNFDVELQSRYKGIYNINPATASMMYYPEEYGNNEVKRMQVK